MSNCNNVTSCFLHRREAEADYIGLMLMASAGYNPRAGPPQTFWGPQAKSQNWDIFFFNHSILN